MIGSNAASLVVPPSWNEDPSHKGYLHFATVSGILNALFLKMTLGGTN